MTFLFRKQISHSLFLLCLLSVSALKAQEENEEIKPQLSYTNDLPNLLPVSDGLNQLTIQGGYRNNSNAVPLSFSLKLLAKGTITKGLKDEINSYPGKRRLFDQEINASLFYQRKIESKDLYLFVGYQYRNLQCGNFSKDALNLALYGNQMFEDKTADLSNINFEYLLYNQYSIGLGKKKKNLYAGVMLSFLQGYSDIQVQNKQGSFYTAPYGEYLDLDYNLTLNQSHEGAPNFFKPLGLGFSGDVHVSYQLKKGILLFDAKDLGFLRWSNESIHYAKDTSFRFEGLIAIDNLLKLNLNSDNILNLDSLQQNLIGAKSKKTYNTILPATFQIVYALPLKIKSTSLQLNVGLNTRILNQYYVMGFVKANIFLTKNFVTSVAVSAGGYSLFNLGWDIGYFTKNIDFLLGTNNLLGLLAPNYYPSTSVNLRFAYKF